MFMNMITTNMNTTTVINDATNTNTNTNTNANANTNTLKVINNNVNTNLSISTQVIKIFNEIFFNFVNLISKTFPNDLEITIAKNKLYAIKKINPKLFIKIWKKHITDKYRDSIEEGNIDYFIGKNYSNDLNKINNSDRIMKCINRLREPIKNMDKSKQDMVMLFIKDLSKISEAIII
jgi:hypothetical protein